MFLVTRPTFSPLTNWLHLRIGKGNFHGFKRSLVGGRLRLLLLRGRRHLPPFLSPGYGPCVGGNWLTLASICLLLGVGVLLLLSLLDEALSDKHRGPLLGIALDRLLRPWPGCNLPLDSRKPLWHPQPDRLLVVANCDRVVDLSDFVVDIVDSGRDITAVAAVPLLVVLLNRVVLLADH